ncbi:MAG: sulfatase-like hydrolase/transferase [Candidatus Eisenbacteria sp.]|nr:sulfatase-like hydrolase/transferase [Candidatus Eisenbacteria bacterium]
MIQGSSRTTSQQDHTLGEALATALLVTSLAVLVGAYAGFLESLLLTGIGSTVMTARAAVNVAVLYGLMFGCLGLVIGLVAMGIGAATGWRTATGRTRCLLGSGVSVFVVLVIAGAYMNELFLPAMISKQALVADGVLLVACVLLWWFIYKASLRWLERSRSLRGWRSPMRWAWLCLVLALMVTGVASPGLGAGRLASERARVAKDLNVLLLVIDALRADHLGCYGYERDTSPNMDTLAEEGVLFRNAYTHGSRTKESTASLVTSLYPSSHNVCNMANAIPVSCATLMNELHGHGYRTAVFSANPLVSPLFGFGRGVDLFYAKTPIAERLVIIPQTLRKPTLRLGVLLAFERKLERLFPLPVEETPFLGGSADTLNSRLLSWIDEEPKAGFFAYVHYMEPHLPYAPPAPFDKVYDPDYQGERITEPPLPSGLTAVPYSEGSELAPEEFRNLVAQYDGSISYVDQEIERLLEGLRSRDLAERTLVIITADHGEELYDRGGWSHGHTVNEELVKVPMILWCPSLVPGGQVAEGVVRHVDIMPTIFGAVGHDSDSTAVWLEGVDLWPCVSGGSGLPVGLPALSEVYSSGSCARSLRVGPHKIIQELSGSDAEYQLFDLSTDPGERRDLSVSRPELLQSMRAELEQMISDSESKKAAVRAGVVDEATKERLESLGYVM